MHAAVVGAALFALSLMLHLLWPTPRWKFPGGSESSLATGKAARRSTRRKRGLHCLASNVRRVGQTLMAGCCSRWGTTCRRSWLLNGAKRETGDYSVWFGRLAGSASPATCPGPGATWRVPGILLMKIPDWPTACLRALRNLQDQRVWSLRDLPYFKKPLHCLQRLGLFGRLPIQNRRQQKRNPLRAREEEDEDAEEVGGVKQLVRHHSLTGWGGAVLVNRLAKLLTSLAKFFPGALCCVRCVIFCSG